MSASDPLLPLDLLLRSGNRAGRLMHFHLPKPLHGWREFAGEVGIIVVGVLIALAGAQVVEKVSWRERVHQAEASMSKELSDDDGSQAYERFAMSPCIAKEL